MSDLPVFETSGEQHDNLNDVSLNMNGTREKQYLGFQARSNTNWPVRAEKMASGLKFQI